MLYEIVEDFPNDIIFNEQMPCISLYQPTHRYAPENKQDIIVFKNLLRDIEHSLDQKNQKSMIDSIMKPFYQIKDDKNFWNKTSDGLAILANETKCIVYKLPISIKEIAIVADSFHIKPLIRFFQSMEKYQLLGLSRNEFTLYQGNRYGYQEIELQHGVPRTMNEVLGEELTNGQKSHGAGDANGVGVYYGTGEKKAEIDKDTERFFRYVDQFVFENYSKISKLPLILVSLKEYHSQFKKLSRNRYLLEEGINSSYESIETKQLNEKALKIIEPIYTEKMKKITDDFNIAKANSLGSDDITQIAKAVFENKVKTVLIEADSMIPGKIDANTGRIELGDQTDPEMDDVLDDIAEFVLKKRGEAVVLPKEMMPCETGIAAIYRYI